MGENFKRKVINVTGMTCNNCENKLEYNISKLQGIKSVKANRHNSSITVEFEENRTNANEIYECIRKLGYRVGISNLKNSTNRLGNVISIATMLVIGFVLVYRNSLAANLPRLNEGTNLFMLFMTGMLAGGPCVAMNYGIVTAQGISSIADGKKSLFEKLKPAIKFNSGRVAMLTIIGVIIGAVGTAIKLSAGVQGLISITMGLFMVLLGVSVSGIFSSSLRLKIPRTIANKLVSIQESLKGKDFYLGLLSGLIPCPATQAVQLYVLSLSNAFSGALYMFAFSLGTVPLLMAASFLGTLFNKNTSGLIMKLSSILIIFLGVSTMSNGISISKTAIFQSNGAENIVKSNEIKDISNGNIQTIYMNVDNDGYSPAALSINKGSKVRWVINGVNPSGCIDTIVVPKLGIVKPISKGENIIEFDLPANADKIDFMCSMGMYRGVINVKKA